MPTPEGVKRFLEKRGIPVRAVESVEGGFSVSVRAKGFKAMEIWGTQTIEECEFSVSEHPDTFRERLSALLRWRPWAA